MQKLKINRLIIVEGKYDKIRLSNIVDADIIAVNGFSVFKDEKVKNTIKHLARHKGAIILTDSDTAGYRLRVYLSKILGGADIINVLAPQLPGKERRKISFSAEGYLGIEGTDDEILYSLLLPYTEAVYVRTDITSSDLYQLGLIGTNGAKARKNDLLGKLGVQKNISNNFLLRLLNERYTKDEFYSLLGK